MKKYSIGKNSARKLKDCHPDWYKIVNYALQISEVDFGIAEGYRTPERQKELFDQGKSKIDGVNRKGKHNHNPSMAIDIYAYHSDPETRKLIAYDRETLCYIAGVILAAAEILMSQDRISHTIRWGGNWDRDGVILKDQSFDDLVHFELR